MQCSRATERRDVDGTWAECWILTLRCWIHLFCDFSDTHSFGIRPKQAARQSEEEIPLQQSAIYRFTCALGSEHKRELVRAGWPECGGTRPRWRDGSGRRSNIWKRAHSRLRS